MPIKRLGQIAAVIASLLAFGGVTPVGADDFLIKPGQISGSGTSGFAQSLDESTSTFFFVEFQTGLETFRPHRPGGPPLITLDTGVANVSFSNLSDSGFGCWLFPKEAVVVGSDLSATLTLDTSDPRVSECPGDPVETSALGAAPAIGPSGLIIGLVEPLQLTVTLTPAGPITTTRSNVRMSCPPFQSIGEGTSQSVGSTTSGSVTGNFVNSGPFTFRFANGTGDFSAGSGKTQIIGPPSAGCGSF